MVVQRACGVVNGGLQRGFLPLEVLIFCCKLRDLLLELGNGGAQCCLRVARVMYCAT